MTTARASSDSQTAAESRKHEGNSNIFPGDIAIASNISTVPESAIRSKTTNPTTDSNNAHNSHSEQAGSSQSVYRPHPSLSPVVDNNDDGDDDNGHDTNRHDDHNLSGDLASSYVNVASLIAEHGYSLRQLFAINRHNSSVSVDSDNESPDQENQEQTRLLSSMDYQNVPSFLRLLFLRQLSENLNQERSLIQQRIFNALNPQSSSNSFTSHRRRRSDFSISDPRLLFYSEEPNVVRGFIKEQSFSPDGRIIASPCGNHVRLLAFDPNCSEICDDIPTSPRQLEEVGQCARMDDCVLTSTFSPVDCMFVAGSRNGSVIFSRPVL